MEEYINELLAYFDDNEYFNTTYNADMGEIYAHSKKENVLPVLPRYMLEEVAEFGRINQLHWSVDITTNAKGQPCPYVRFYITLEEH